MGTTWLDWAILAWVLGFAVRGFLRGTIAQVFVVLGLAAGVWVGLWAFRWLGDHWQAAQPALAFLALRWVVTILLAAAVLALFQWWGEGLGRSMRATAIAWLDRGMGLAMGAALGVATVALGLMTALALPGPAGLTDEVARARATMPLLGGAAEACALGSRLVPGGRWLEERFRRAERRVLRVREEAQRPSSRREAVASGARSAPATGASWTIIPSRESNTRW